MLILLKKKNHFNIKTENEEIKDFLHEHNSSNKKNISKQKFLPKIVISKFKKPFQISKNTTKVKNESIEKYNFNSKYQILKLLGKGSNSSVYLARKKSSSNLYAVKKVSKLKLLKDNELKNFKVIHFKFKNEIKSLKKLKDLKEISRFKELLKDEEYFYLVMEYKGETNLRQYLENNPNISVKINCLR